MAESHFFLHIKKRIEESKITEGDIWPVGFKKEKRKIETFFCAIELNFNYINNIISPHSKSLDTAPFCPCEPNAFLNSR